MNWVRDGIEYMLDMNGTASVIDIDRTLQTVKIPSRVKNCTVITISACAASNSKLLQKVEIPATVESIGSMAFSGCCELKEVIIKGRFVQIFPKAFMNCEKLTDVSANVICSEAEVFSGCKSLDMIQALFAGRIQSNLFANCEKLLMVEFGNEVSIHNEIFAGCSNLKVLSFCGNADVSPNVLDKDVIIQCKKNSNLWALEYDGFVVSEKVL